ncbi:histone-lysine N-methyltransferase SETDB2 isoform X2 [Diceros bicornis minor]|uniref:histone-lysine N-methyltransferase SETDB2 isoform X2 n=1 Tax=Diceros bicornis minor TaxID=77932 RepID=UPI0026EF200D|nr:histone-lysine N-methyltransferase SETDB2 isoform X2 [Diceros bicornis minor]
MSFLAGNFPLPRGNQSSRILRKRNLAAAGELPAAQRSAAYSSRAAAVSAAMDQAVASRPASAPGAACSEAQDALPRPTGVFQVTEKMEKRTCALCPKDLECSVLYFAQSENIAAHENCLLYSSALVECEDHDPRNNDRNFDVKSVKKEIKRGSKLKCKFCGEKGATVGCDVKACSKSYHFFCAKNDNAVLQTDGSQGIYKVFCQQHAPWITQNDLLSETLLRDVFHSHDNQGTQQRHADFSGVKRKRRRKKRLSADIQVQSPEAAAFNRGIKQMHEDDRHTDAIVKVAFLKKCKEAGLLNDLFEEILDKLHLIQQRLMDKTTSESDYEEIGTSLLDCRLFDDIFVNFQAEIENKIHQSEERQQQLKEEIELLRDLKQTLCSLQENRDLRSSSTSESSLSS